jgi:hypothetical protein
MEKFLIQDVLGIRADPKRCLGKRFERIEDIVNGRWAQALPGDAIAAGFDVSDMRYLNGAKAQPALGPLEECLIRLLEQMSMLHLMHI